MIVIDWAGSSDNLLGFWTYCDRPRRSSLVNAWGVGPEEIGIGICVKVGQPFHPLDAGLVDGCKASRGEGEKIIGGREERSSRRPD